MNIHELYKLLLLTIPKDIKVSLEEEVITIHVTEYYKSIFPVTHNILIAKHGEELIAFTSYTIDPLPEWFTAIFNVKKAYASGVYAIEPKE